MVIRAGVVFRDSLFAMCPTYIHDKEWFNHDVHYVGPNKQKIGFNFDPETGERLV